MAIKDNRKDLNPKTWFWRENWQNENPVVQHHSWGTRSFEYNPPVSFVGIRDEMNALSLLEDSLYPRSFFLQKKRCTTINMWDQHSLTPIPGKSENLQTIQAISFPNQNIPLQGTFNWLGSLSSHSKLFRIERFNNCSKSLFMGNCL